MSNNIPGAIGEYEECALLRKKMLGENNRQVAEVYYLKGLGLMASPNHDKESKESFQNAINILNINLKNEKDENTINELKSIMQQIGAESSDQCEKIIQKVDTNHDGEVSYAEFMQVMRMLKRGEETEFGKVASKNANRLKAQFEQAIKDATPKKIKTEVVWRPKADAQAASPQLKKQREKPQGGPPPKKSVSDLP